MNERKSLKTLGAITSNLVTTSLQDAFETQTQTSIEIIRIDNRTFCLADGTEVAASVSLIGESLRGFISLSFPTDTYLAIANRALNRELGSINTESMSIAIQLVSAIHSSATRKLKKSGFILQESMPMAFAGRNLTFAHRSPMTTRITCQCQFGPIFADIGVESA